MKPLLYDMINPLTGTPFVYGDPNLFYGYYLEPGDPGFTPYPSVSQTQQKPKRMRRQAYYPSRIADQITWLENFRNKVLAYVATLGLDPAATAAIVADCRWLIYILGTWLPAGRAWGPACTDTATEAQTGTGNAPLALPIFTAPALPAGVVAMPPGSLDRIFAFVQTIKNSAGRTDAVEADLGTIGSAPPPVDLADLQPVITAKINGLHVDLHWNWGGHSNEVDLLQIQVDRSDGKGWVDLVHDTTPNYTDTTPFPATATVWKYRAIFQVNGAPIGQWSATVSVAVGG